MSRDTYIKFEAKQGDGVVTSKVMPHSDSTWPELFEEFRNFLNGMGYSVPAGEWEEHDEDIRYSDWPVEGPPILDGEEESGIDVTDSNYDMPHDMDSPFSGDIYQCKECKCYIRSSYPGEFVDCGCGKSFVDQTREYTRVGGEAVLATAADIAKDEVSVRVYEDK